MSDGPLWPVPRERARPGRRQSVDGILAAREHHWPEAVVPIARLMTRVFRFGKLMLEKTSQTSAAHGLSYAEFEVLATLRSTPAPHELMPTELTNGTLLSSGGLTKVLYALQEKHLVARSDGGSDRRSKPVRLTARGRALAERVMAEVIRADEALILDHLTQAELQSLTLVMRRLLEALEPLDARPSGPARAVRTRRPRARRAP